MILRDSCYICSSPFQLIPIICLAISRNENADLYIDSDFNRASEYAYRIRATHIFCNVILIDADLIYSKIYTREKGFLHNIETAKSYLNVNSISRMILQEDISYKNMFVSSNAYFSRIIYFYFVKNKFNISLKYFEDGIGSYIGDSAYKTRLLDRIIRHMLFGRQANSFRHERFLFSPKIFHVLNPYNSDLITDVPRIWEVKKNKELLNEIFSLSNKSATAIRERIIILDQPKNEIFKDNQSSLLVDIYRLVVNIAGKYNVILKKHPREKESDLAFVNNYLDFGVIFESLCINTDMSEKVLISHSSTAVITPKLFLGQEPTIILLYKLIESGMGSCENRLLNDFFESIKETYSDKNKFIIPKNVLELKDVLLKFHYESP